ncbi:MAG: FAD-binding oxidoreductase [Deltaproteobacteria bacterium]|nr:FAD-binding oxidoreductase [Deltaproteobacteria bacterium]
MSPDAIIAWASAHGVRCTTREAWPRGDFRTDPRIDFGRWLERTPGCVLHPTDVDQLAAVMRELAAQGVPFTTRAAAHSAGGQVLSDGGAVIDLRGLDRIVADDPAAQTITVESGAWWLAVTRHLAPARRRPPVLTDNLRSSIGGTLAVGGFGDATHRHGLQAQQVRAMTVVTVDGTRHIVRPGDALFDHALCGRGQLAVIADATLTTVRRSAILHGRMLHWRSLAAYIDGAIRAMDGGHYDVFRARMAWQPGLPVSAVAGDLDAPITPLARIRPDDASPLEQLDLAALAEDDPHARWDFASPALELALPLPDGLATWYRLVERVAEAGLQRFMPRGSSVMVVKSPVGLPLAPVPPGGLALFGALRLELPPAEAPRVVPILRELGRQAMREGARVYLMSIELEADGFLEQQFGAALPRLRALKDQHDPRRLLNPWLL